MVDPSAATGRIGRAGAWTASDTRRLLLLVLAALLLFGYGLGGSTLWDQDETRYFQIARELLQGGDPFELRYDGQPWFVHPPLFFWLQALTARVFGFTEAVARVWSAISAAVMAAGAFLIGRVLYGSDVALLAGAISATTLHVLAQARLAAFDPTLVAFMLLAFYMYLVAYTTGRRHAHLWAWLWAGCATATKGPIGLMLPGMVVIALWVVRRDWHAWRRIPLLGPVIFIATGTPWYIVETVRHGAAFLRAAVGYYLLGRFLGVVEEQAGPWWYYGPVLLLGMIPWTAFAPSAVALLLRERRDLGSQVILLWCGVTIAFYSAAGTKLPNYVLPVYPVLAVGVARLLVDAFRSPVPEGRRRMRWATVLLPIPSLLLMVALVAFGRMKFPAETQALRVPLGVAVAALAGGPLVAWALMLRGRLRAATAALLLVPVVLVLVLVHYTLPAIETQRPLPRISRWIRQELRPGDTLVAVRMRTALSLRFYSEHTVHWAGSRHALIQELCGDRRVFAVVSAGDADAAAVLRQAGARLRLDDRGIQVHVKEGPFTCSGDRAPRH